MSAVFKDEALANRLIFRAAKKTTGFRDMTDFFGGILVVFALLIGIPASIALFGAAGTTAFPALVVAAVIGGGGGLLIFWGRY